MVILEVTLPSGFVAEADTLINVSNSFNVKKVETKNADTIIIVYFDNFVANKEVCPVFDAFRAHKVADQKPVSVAVYDYYDSGTCFFRCILLAEFHLVLTISADRATAFYNAPEFNTIPSDSGGLQLVNSTNQNNIN